MGGKLRYLLALGFVGLFFAIPQPDHEYLAYLKTREWLMQGEPAADVAVAEKPPFSRAIAPGEPMPALQVDVRPENRVAEYGRIAREWARAGEHPTDAGPPLRLVVRIGDQGFRSTLLRPTDAGYVEIDHFEVTRDGSAGYYPGRASLVPAFLAIVLAILTGKVVLSLLLGSLAGAVLFVGPLAAAGHFVGQTLWSQTLSEDFNLSIMGFVIFLFMAIGIMARSGGIQGMVEWVRRFARGPLSSQLCSYVIGILIFFDDYSNCIITGTTMRPLTDRSGVAREKLAYIVDSTAAPVAGISIVSTWVAYEISMFRDQLPEVTKQVTDAAGAVTEVAYGTNEAFSVFVQTLPYRFYCIFTLMMVLLTIVMRREFGPMLTAARRAAIEGKPVADDARPMVSRGFSDLRAPDGAPIRGRNAFVPVLVLVTLAIGLILWIGYQRAAPEHMVGSLGEKLRTMLNNTQSERALFWAALVALVAAIAMAVSQRILKLGNAIGSAVKSVGSLGIAIVILILAWSIGHVCQDLGTAHFLTAAFHGSFAPWLLPVVMFLLSALVAFSTGTSYGTMAILLPNVVVLAHTMGQQDPTIGGTGLMLLTIGAVLEGSIFGDHCSPISDTTVLSSVATASDHLHHVRTQAPYAVFVMAVAVVCGYLPMALGNRDLWPLAWAAGATVIAATLWFAGRSVPGSISPQSGDAGP